VSEWAFLALGSNLGDRLGNLEFAREQLSQLPDTVFVRESSLLETEPLGPVDQERYLNQMVLLMTDLSVRSLLKHCQDIERRAGRVRSDRWGPRTLDVDIVRFGDAEISDDDLVVPHPEIPNREFWRMELAELEPYARR